MAGKLSVALVCASVLHSPLASAQPSAGKMRSSPAAEAPMDPDKTARLSKSRELYSQGVAAYGKGRWQDAYTAFAGAWALNEHFTTAGNLGATELKLGLDSEAARHLAIYLQGLAGDPEASAREKENARAMMAEARARVGVIAPRVSVADAEIWVDGGRVAPSPPEGVLFVEPGEHRIEARAKGFQTALATVQVSRGERREVSLALPAVETPLAAGDGQEGEGGGELGRVARRGASSPADARDAQRAEPRTALIVMGAVATSLGVVAGTILTVTANGRSSDAEAYRKQLEATGTSCPPAATSGICGGLRGALSARDTLSSAAAWTFLGAGVVGGATVAYSVLASSRASASPRMGSRSTPSPRMWIAPGSVPAGVTLRGDF
ncbi:hypothetical protein [Chondromyces apiculatus]|uniref:PEGA domain-containing protein n=1 Tax=Chondromyces apiculatus DSM 436 TaxID=1192034 RepID=A0A017SVV9_9BACT|nr:hypothetical protein [Chondromyces apiculatus]EYF01074.1 Hypothetical protein CAP_8731 [Chondromyces apiculatus DSM 436]